MAKISKKKFHKAAIKELFTGVYIEGFFQILKIKESGISTVVGA